MLQINIPLESRVSNKNIDGLNIIDSFYLAPYGSLNGPILNHTMAYEISCKEFYKNKFSKFIIGKKDFLILTKNPLVNLPHRFFRIIKKEKNIEQGYMQYNVKIATPLQIHKIYENLKVLID